MTEQRPLLSLVIPAYNEAEPDRLPESLKKITQFVESQDFAIEVIIINNNSTDDTLRIAEAAAEKHAYIRVFTESTQGKGAAVRTGMKNATGDYLFICDADLSMPIEEVLKFIPPKLDNFDIAIASREIEGAVRVDEPEIRHLMGRVFNFIVRVLAVRGLDDTQCGFKCFRREVATDVFALQQIDGWSFDVEILFIAQKRGYQILEVPITWIYKDHSKIKPLMDSYHMVMEILKIRRFSKQGLYE